jgi:ATP-dependent helicase/nuclease subunit B
MVRMGLALVVGPAHAGKVALLLERFLEALPHNPWLIVPNRPDVERVERDLIRRRGALLAGSIGTFDDLFRAVAEKDPQCRPVATEAQCELVVRRAVAEAALNGLGRSAASGGFADALQVALGELEAGLVEPEALDGDLRALHESYRDELDRLGRWDRDLLRRRAAELLGRELDAWSGEPVFAYGFEDLTGAEWSLLHALAGRAEVTVSLPYEPGRSVFASLSRTADDLLALADGQLQELPPRTGEQAPAALVHIERSLFVDAPATGPPLGGSVRFLEGAGARGTLELVVEEVLDLVRDGTAPEQIGIVCDSLERWRAPLDTVFSSFEVPYAVEGRIRLVRTPFGGALASLLRFAWLGGARGDLFGFLRSPYSGLSRSAVDYVEGRLRGRAVHERERVEAEAERLRGAPIEVLATLDAAESPLAGVRTVAASLARNAYGLTQPPASDSARADLRAAEGLRRLLDELVEWEALAGPLTPDQIVGALERATLPAPPAGERGRVAVLDLMRARTRSFEVVFVLGLEEGALPRRGRPSPFLDDERRRSLGGRLEQSDPVSRDRYLFYTACTRAERRLYLVREAVSDDGSAREAGPFWHEVVRLFDPAEVRRVTRRRRLSALTWPIVTAPSERERLRALARLHVEDAGEARALADANGWTRRLDRASAAFSRPTRLSHPAVLAWLGERSSFSVTELERFADCSSAWLVERVITPKTIDAEPDAMLRGSIAHTTLSRFYGALPRELGAERVTREQLEPALELMRRCLDEALESGVRLDLTALQGAELRQSLRRDLEAFVRDEAESPLALVPRRLEAAFGSERAAPELQRGLQLDEQTVLTGKIDRVDIDPFSARGIVQDYKSGQGAYSAERIDQELLLQIPLYMLVLRDLVGVEPLGGLYRPLAGKRIARGMLRAEAVDDLPGFSRNDYLSEEEFWTRVERARERAAAFADRIRRGDVQHDPKGDDCPSWCDLWRVCRVGRP